eukprot:UN15931
MCSGKIRFELECQCFPNKAHDSSYTPCPITIWSHHLKNIGICDKKFKDSKEEKAKKYFESKNSIPLLRRISKKGNLR